MIKQKAQEPSFSSMSFDSIDISIELLRAVSDQCPIKPIRKPPGSSHCPKRTSGRGHARGKECSRGHKGEDRCGASRDTSEYTRKALAEITSDLEEIDEKKAGFMAAKFKLEHEYIELIKLLKVTGLCGSGGMAGVVTSEGRVKVDGVVELRKRCKLRKGQTVELEGNIIELE